MLSNLDATRRIHFGDGRLCSDSHVIAHHPHFIVVQGSRIAASQKDSVHHTESIATDGPVLVSVRKRHISLFQDASH